MRTRKISEEEHLAELETLNEFWRELGRLTSKTLAKVAEDRRDDFFDADARSHVPLFALQRNLKVNTNCEWGVFPGRPDVEHLFDKKTKRVLCGKHRDAGYFSSADLDVPHACAICEGRSQAHAGMPVVLCYDTLWKTYFLGSPLLRLTDETGYLEIGLDPEWLSDAELREVCRQFDL